MDSDNQSLHQPGKPSQLRSHITYVEHFEQILTFGIFFIFILLISLGAPETAPVGAGCAPLTTPCINGKYRTIDGTCNNLKYPTWGAANTKYGRLVRPKYADGKSRAVQIQNGYAIV